MRTKKMVWRSSLSLIDDDKDLDLVMWAPLIDVLILIPTNLSDELY